MEELKKESDTLKTEKEALEEEKTVMEESKVDFYQSDLNAEGSSVSEWLGHSLVVLGVDGSTLLTMMLWFQLPLRLTDRFHSLRWIRVGHLP